MPKRIRGEREGCGAVIPDGASPVFLTTGSRDNTWSRTVVDPATGTVVGTTTEPVPPEIDEPTDIHANGDGDVYILGKSSKKIARIPGALKQETRGAGGRGSPQPPLRFTPPG